MEPASKKARLLTDHFRVALKPRDLNVPVKRKQIQVVTISDDEDDTKCKPLDTRNANKPQQHNSKVNCFLSTICSSPHNKYLAPPGKHPNILDYDKTLLNNVCWEPHYAWDSFNYDRQQETKFKTEKYLNNEDDLEHELMAQRRAELVDWLVEIQMTFVLDHEPLYMAIKLADQYLMKKHIPSEQYQLLFMTCILISAKFDERVPPITISDLIQLAKSKFGIKYNKKQIISLEVDLLSTLNFNIRFPLSYGFLRRFARCTRSDMKTLNLARYILESSLMDYEMIDVLESKMAAGSLLLAFRMLRPDGAWDETARFYTGYEEKELHPLLVRLNDVILRFSRRKTAIRRKYSHESFMEVARISPVLPELLANR